MKYAGKRLQLPNQLTRRAGVSCSLWIHRVCVRVMGSMGVCPNDRAYLASTKSFATDLGMTIRQDCRRVFSLDVLDRKPIII